MRVLHVQKVAGVAGSERHLLSLLPGLAAAGVETRICVMAAPGGDAFVDRLREAGVPHLAVRAGPDANPIAVNALRREIGRYRPDLVHTHLVHADLHGQLAARIARVPGISSVHGTPSFYERQPYRGARRVVGRWTRRTIAISEHVRTFLESHGLARPQDIRVIPYGIEPAAWRGSEAQRAETRAALDLGPEDVAVGIASRLIPGKGHDFLLDGHRRARERAPRLRLLIAGDGPLRSELERRAGDLNGDVRFLGFVADVGAFMNACDIVAFPTQPELSEGFGLAALEAMAAARPVIATAVGSLPEVVQPEETGLLVDPTSVDALATALVRLAEDDALRAELGGRGRRRAESTFSLERMLERTMTVYGEALAGS